MSESIPLSNQQLIELGRSIYDALSIYHGCNPGDCGELRSEWAGPDALLWRDIAAHVARESKLVPQYVITEFIF